MVEFQPNGYTKELEFGYSTKMEGYTNLSSDITELGEITTQNFITPLICTTKNRNMIKYELVIYLIGITKKKEGETHG